MIRIWFAVETMVALGAGEQVYVAGSPAEMGAWNPAGVAMRRVDETHWEAEVELEEEGPIECKITRGSWGREAVDEFGHVPANWHLTARDGMRAEICVAGWKDGVGTKAPPRIAGDWEVVEGVESAFLEEKRDVIVWLPPGYAAHPERRYPVLYLHDGRQVFNPATSTWGKDWQVDEHGLEMVLSGEVEPFIAVAADCTEARGTEYHPDRGGEAYVRFLTEELKPMVDARWRTDPERSFTAGSSLGGLMAFYEAWTRPGIFGAAACLSPAFGAGIESRCAERVEADGAAGQLPDVRLFLSCGGTGDLEKRLLAGTLEMVDRLKCVGFPEDRMEVHVEGWAEHNEESWERMVPRMLKFFFGRR